MVLCYRWLLPVRYRLVESAHGGRGRAGRGRRYKAGVPYARSPGVGRRRRGRRGGQRELADQGQADRVVERVRVQHACFLAVRHTDGHHDGDGAGAGGDADEDPNGLTPLAV